MSEPIYKDIDFLFRKTPFGIVKTATDEEVIRQSIFTILETRKGERVMNPTFGTNLFNILFEPMDDITASDISHEIRTALIHYEPRIRVNSVIVVPNYDEGYYIININYDILKLNVSRDIILGAETQNV